MTPFHFQIPLITMVKRRNAEKRNYTGAEGIISSSTKDYGGGGCNYNRFSVFDFADDDLRVETESRKTLAKFGTKSPGKKPALHLQPIDKDTFLQCFAPGTTTQQKNLKRDVLDVDVTDSASQNITFWTDRRTTPSSLNYDHPSYSLKKQGFEYSSCGAKSCGSVCRKPGGYTTGKKHDKVLNVDCDEDGRMDLRSSSSFDLAENEGSLKESEYGANDNDCEAVVVVSPHYVTYENMHYRRCRLTFSQRFIRLEGSPLCERRKTLSFEWPTFDILKIKYQQCGSVQANIVNLHLKSKYMNVNDAVEGNSGSVELEFVVLDDPQWSEKLEDIKSLDLKYKAAWETIISECNLDESFENITYPEGDPDAVFISRRDVELLQPGTFINDTIIDFYIKYLINKTDPEKQRRFHFFNTFFFQKLLDMRRDQSQTWERSDDFQRVRKWTRNVNIFEKDYIFIPVNLSLHWNKGMDGSPTVPCILHMDSIRGSHGGFEKLIRRYLWEEWKEQGNKQEEDFSKNLLTLDFIALQLPQQENFFDCGLFLLHYAELFLEQAFNSSATKYVDFLNEDWFFAVEVSLKKRDHIRKLIHRIAKEYSVNKDPPAAHNNQHLQSGVNEGDSCSDSVQPYDVKESPCLGQGFNSSDDFRSKGQECSSVKLGRNSSVIDEFQPYKPQVPINQFTNMTLPMADTLGNRAAFLLGDTSSSYEAGVDDSQISSRYPLSSFAPAKMKVSQEASSSNSPIIIDVQDEQDCVSGVASSMSSEELEACIIEDSEEESETESLVRTRKSSHLA
ncbi:hypothetical protein OROMI_033308 [Orobanche minor]